MTQPLKIMGWFIVGLLLYGCSEEQKTQALKAYVDQVKSRSAMPIEPLPEVKPYQSFIYSAQELRSPFVPPKPQEEQVVIALENGIRPDIERRKEALEGFPLDSLRMVGTLEQNSQVWAVIMDTDGVVHRITQGHYVGQNHGKVVQILEEKVVLKEIIPDGRGGWQEREASMALLDE